VVIPDTVAPVVPALPDTREPAHSARQRIIDELRRSGGSVRSSQRELAKVAGVTPSRVNALLKSMSDQGAVNVRAGSTGTVVELA
jgi:DNA-binding MarR family transcriptional regulator